MIAGSVVVYVASAMAHHGYAWADQVCGYYNVCDHFYWLVAATAIVILLYFISNRAEA